MSVRGDRTRAIGAAIIVIGITVVFCLSLWLGGNICALAQETVQRIRVGNYPCGVGLNSTTNKKYVPCEDSDFVSVLGPDNTRIKDIPVGSKPCSVGVNELSNRIFIANRASNSVSVIDGNSDTVLKTIAVGKAPRGICVNSNTQRAYVANFESDSVSVINTLTNSVMGAIAVGDGPDAICANPNTNKIFAANRWSDTVSVIDGATDRVAGSVEVGDSPCAVDVIEATNKVYVTNNSDDTVSVIDTTSARVTNTIKLPSDSAPVGIRADNETIRVYISCYNSNRISVINASGLPGAWIETGTYPTGLDVDPRTNMVYVANAGSGNVSVIHDPTDYVFYFAEGTTRPGFSPYICVQNLGDQEADVKITYMLGDGTEKEQVIRIAPRSRATAKPSDVLGSANDASCDFSAKVECTNGQKIVAERPMYFSYGGLWTGGHDVVGATGGNVNAYFAEGTTRHGFLPYLCIQNPNDEPNCVRVSLGTAETFDFKMAPHSRLTIPCNEFVEPDTDFPISVTSVSYLGAIRSPFVAERPMYFDYNGLTDGSDIVGTASPSSVFYFAEGTTRPDFDSFVCIDALGEAQLKLTFMLGDGTTKIHEFTASSRTTVNCRDILGTGDDPSHDFSLKVESTNGVPIVAERPMYFNYKGVWTGGHDVLGTASPSRSFSFAEGSVRPNFHTYFCIQNPEDGTANVKITYMKGDGTNQEQTLEVVAHSRYTVACHDLFGNVDNLAHDFSARVECTNGRNIVVERPMYFDYHGWTGGHDVVGFQD